MDHVHNRITITATMSEPQIFVIDHELLMKLVPISRSQTAITFIIRDLNNFQNNRDNVVPKGLTIWDITEGVKVKPTHNNTFIICYANDYMIKYKNCTYNIQRRSGWDMTTSYNHLNESDVFADVFA